MKEINVDISFVRRVYGNKAVVNNGLCLFLDNRSGVNRFPYRIKNLCCYFCLSGEIDVLINGEEHHIQASSFVVYLPESVVEEKRISTDFRCAVIMLDASIILALPIPELPNMLIYMISHPVFPSCNVLEEHILYAWKGLRIIAESESPYRNQCIGHLIAMMVYHPLSSLPEMIQNEMTVQDISNLDSDEQIVRQCVILIKKHCTKERFVDFYAAKLNVTSTVLNTAFRKRVGCSVTEYIHRTVMRYACVLLVTTNASVTEIAYNLGFKASSHFVSFFKKYVGVTPETFRHDKQYWDSIETDMF